MSDGCQIRTRASACLAVVWLSGSMTTCITIRCYESDGTTFAAGRRSARPISRACGGDHLSRSAGRAARLLTAFRGGQRAPVGSAKAFGQAPPGPRDQLAGRAALLRGGTRYAPADRVASAAGLSQFREARAHCSSTARAIAPSAHAHTPRPRSGLDSGGIEKRHEQAPGAPAQAARRAKRLGQPHTTGRCGRSAARPCAPLCTPRAILQKHAATLQGNGHLAETALTNRVIVARGGWRELDEALMP